MSSIDPTATTRDLTRHPQAPTAPAPEAAPADVQATTQQPAQPVLAVPPKPNNSLRALGDRRHHPGLRRDAGRRRVPDRQPRAGRLRPRRHHGAGAARDRLLRRPLGRSLGAGAASRGRLRVPVGRRGRRRAGPAGGHRGRTSCTRSVAAVDEVTYDVLGSVVQAPLVEEFGKGLGAAHPVLGRPQALRRARGRHRLRGRGSPAASPSPRTSSTSAHSCWTPASLLYPRRLHGLPHPRHHVAVRARHVHALHGHRARDRGPPRSRPVRRDRVLPPRA